MCAYNAVGGKPACANDFLLKQKLRHDRNFKGYVVSDFDAVGDLCDAIGRHSSQDKEHAAAAAILNGTNLNCSSTYLALADSVRHGLLKESHLDLPLQRVLRERMQLGLTNPTAPGPYDALPLKLSILNLMLPFP